MFVGQSPQSAKVAVVDAAADDVSPELRGYT
jgi:hypothetical protein